MNELKTKSQNFSWELSLQMQTINHKLKLHTLKMVADKTSVLFKIAWNVLGWTNCHLIACCISDS